MTVVRGISRNSAISHLGETIHEEQDRGKAVGLGQSVERPHDLRANQPLLQRLARGLGLPHVVIQWDDARLIAAQAHIAPVFSYPPQPGGEVIPLPKLTQRLIGSDECILGHILRLLRISNP